MKPGNATSEAEVSHVSKHGIWVLLSEGEFFLPFEQFPWFEKGPVAAVLNVQRLSDDHLYWTDLDVDLSVASIREPARYPLVARDAVPAETEVRESAAREPEKG